MINPMKKNNARPLSLFANIALAIGLWGICIFIVILLKVLVRPGFDASPLLILPVIVFSKSLGIWKNLLISFVEDCPWLGK